MLGWTVISQSGDCNKIDPSTGHHTTIPTLASHEGTMRVWEINLSINSSHVFMTKMVFKRLLHASLMRGNTEALATNTRDNTDR